MRALKSPGFPQVKLLAAAGPNKVFLFTFDDGAEAIARSPFPSNYHRSHMIVEISTMLFVRQFYNFPTPRLYAWSVEQGSASPVGASFLLMERLPDRTFAYTDFSYILDEETKLKILRAITIVASAFRRFEYAWMSECVYGMGPRQGYFG